MKENIFCVYEEWRGFRTSLAFDVLRNLHSCSYNSTETHFFRFINTPKITLPK